MTIPPDTSFTSVDQAMDALRSALAYLAGSDADGADLDGLSQLAEEMLSQVTPPDRGQDEASSPAPARLYGPLSAN